MTPESPPEDEHEDDSDDLLAGLRDSLQAMENVAAELERASGRSATDDGIPSTEDTPAGDGRRSAGRPVTHRRTRRHTIMLRPLDTLLLALGRLRLLGARADGLPGSYRARRARAATAPLSRLTHPPRKYAIRMASTSSSPRS